MTQFKPGDRVRVTYEGVVDRHDSNVFLKVKTATQFYTPFLNDPATTIEKIVEPEPEWVKGDAITVNSREHSLVFNGEEWRCTCRTGATEPPEYVSQWWKKGTVTILHKVDA